MELIDVNPERNERHGRSGGILADHLAQQRRLVLAVGEDRRDVPQRIGVPSRGPGAAQLRKPFRQADRHVDERWPDEPAAAADGLHAPLSCRT